ncbi:MAG: sugar phosphate isomerase/epimerase [Puniceicoccaceae bacterium]|nr:MAG: sugar phosphate isomerase/epimerase [Puniceicoccaceae bacterium]
MTASLAFQLYAVRNECQKDLAATLKTLAGLGYRGAEPWGYNGEKLEWLGHPPAKVRELFDAAGLTCCGIHLATAALDANLANTTELCRILGCKYLVIAGDRQRMSSAAGVTELAGILNRAAEKLTPHGMACGYHAHGFDFQPIEGKTPWEMLADQTTPEVVLQMDIGNCRSGGGDPIALLKKYPNRSRSIHLKDYDGGPEAALGDGTVDWAEVFAVIKSHQSAAEWLVVEEGEAKAEGFDIARRSIETARKHVD